MTLYAEPPVVVTGQTMSAANWNTWVVDVAKALWVYTAVGQIPYSTASNSLAGLSKPTVDAVLKNTSAGTLTWKAMTDIAPGTTAGDVDYYTAAAVKARLAKPAANSVLQNTSGGVLSWKALTDFLFSVIYKRQGGSSGSWNTEGSTNYTPTTSIIQAGVRPVTVSTISGTYYTGYVTITFPSAFANEPLVLLSVISNHGEVGITAMLSSISASQIQIRVMSPVSIVVNVSWIAMGQ